MSDSISISTTNLSAIDNDRHDLRVEMATRIGAFLGIHPSLLLFTNGQESAIGRYISILKKVRQIKRNDLTLMANIQYCHLERSERSIREITAIKKCQKIDRSSLNLSS